ncbi:hypothetical protein V6Z11_A01G188800 [Gossypium hirsutum]
MEDKIGRLIILIMCCSILKGAVSQVYSVGDENGWSSEVDYGSWSEKYNFTVGDVLEFTYNKGQHNVFEVTESTHRTCDASSGVLAKYESGDDKVELTESKKYWFICNVNGHCLGGMRFGVDVKAGNTSRIQSYKVQSPFFIMLSLKKVIPNVALGTGMEIVELLMIVIIIFNASVVFSHSVKLPTSGSHCPHQEFETDCPLVSPPGRRTPFPSKIFNLLWSKPSL